MMKIFSITIILKPQKYFPLRTIVYVFFYYYSETGNRQIDIIQIFFMFGKCLAAADLFMIGKCLFKSTREKTMYV